MAEDLAVVLDVAGTMLKMYRVAKDIPRGLIIEKVVTWELIMEKKSRALVVPQIDPSKVTSCPPQEPVRTLIDGREDSIEISCASTPVSREEAIRIIQRSSARMADIQEVYRAVRERCPNKYQTTGMIIDIDLEEIAYTISTGGKPFPGLKGVLEDIEAMGADVYVASGDSMRSLAHLTDLGIRPDRIYPVADPRRKREIVISLKDKYGKVVMVGDGLNDIYALQAADLGILSVQQESRPAPSLLQTADEIIRDIIELPGLLKKVLRTQRTSVPETEYLHSSIT
ncbi:MAG: HAD family hydrolase [Methanotrichaceae archaeon]|nr:HAD family hydrolase [Methanotrichaceae archaeon]